MIKKRGCMQVNLNTHYNQFKPSFKARLSDDEETQECLKRLVKKDPVATLALRLAVESDDQHSEVGIHRWSMDKWYFQLSGPRFCPKNQTPMGLLYGYVNSINNRFFESPEYYIEKAKEIINNNKNMRMLTIPRR